MMGYDFLFTSMDAIINGRKYRNSQNKKYVFTDRYLEQTKLK